jgi:hypothetical protein
MKELKQSAVIFNEEQHTYSLDGKELSGITSIIKRYVFPDMYKNVSESVLNKAAERGTRIHNLIQMWTVGVLSNDDIQELQPFLDAYYASGLDGYEAEYLVSDNESVASSIDLVCLDKDNNIVLCDIKTTSVLHTEYLQWQLSIYAYLFEKQNPGLQVHSLSAIHIRDGKCNFVEVQRLPDEYVVALLDAYKSGAEIFDNPLRAIPDGLDAMLAAYAENEQALAELAVVSEPYEQRKKELQESIASSLKDSGLSKIETPIAKVTIGKDSERKSFDLKAFQESELYKGNPNVYGSFIKTTTTKGRVTITTK